MHTTPLYCTSQLHLSPLTSPRRSTVTLLRRENPLLDQRSITGSNKPLGVPFVVDYCLFLISSIFSVVVALLFLRQALCHSGFPLPTLPVSLLSFLQPSCRHLYLSLSLSSPAANCIVDIMFRFQNPPVEVANQPNLTHRTCTLLHILSQNTYISTHVRTVCSESTKITIEYHAQMYDSYSAFHQAWRDFLFYSNCWCCRVNSVVKTSSH